jgi:hypothetical protein
VTMFFWVKSPCGSVGKSQRFVRTALSPSLGAEVTSPPEDGDSTPLRNHQNCHPREHLKSHLRKILLIGHYVFFCFPFNELVAKVISYDALKLMIWHLLCGKL